MKVERKMGCGRKTGRGWERSRVRDGLLEHISFQG
jgi:hypothetical protein